VLALIAIVFDSYASPESPPRSAGAGASSWQAQRSQPEPRKTWIATACGLAMMMRFVAAG